MNEVMGAAAPPGRSSVCEGKTAMARSARRWVRVRELTRDDKAAIGARCDGFIAEVLTPRFLPEVVPSQWNYPISLHGKWRGSKFSFFLRYRSGWEDDAGEEFDSAWVRLDHDEECLTETRFHVMWHRHTGQWFPYRASATLDDALRMIETDPILHPPV